MKWVVDKSEGDARLDRFLVEKSGQSRQWAKQRLDEGGVRVNGKKVMIAKWQVQPGDRIDVQASRRGNEARMRKASHHFIEVIHEDRDVIVVVKEAGVPVKEDVEEADFTLLDQVRSYLMRKNPGARGTFAKPVHRLDTDTSGVMVLAKSKEGEALIQQFKGHTIRRVYWAVVNGQIEDYEGKIDMPLAKGDFGHGRKVAAMPDGKKAISRYRVLERYLTATLVEVELQTGRTHQVRAHMAAIGHPVIGDVTYGIPGSGIEFPRQALHAHLLRFHHPVTGEVIEATAPLPTDMETLVDHLRDEC